MNRLLHLLLSILSILIRLIQPGGTRALVAENVVLRQQLAVMSRHCKRTPSLTIFNCLLFGFLSSFIQLTRLSKIAITVKSATLLKLHKAFAQRKHHLLYTPKIRKKPGPKGPDQAVIDAIVEMKKRNPRFGYRRIAMQITLAFGIDMDKDTVFRVLGNHFHRPYPKGQGSSWLTFLGHMKDSLWSLDLFRCETILMKTYWVMLVMHQFTRRLVGLAVQAGTFDGTAVCCLFNKIIAKHSLPKYLSSDNDPLFVFHRWQANLRILEIQEIKTVPYVPISHPFVERLIGTIRQEYLDYLLFWNSSNLQNKLNDFLGYYNAHRGHSLLNATTPSQQANNPANNVMPLERYRWQSHCQGLFELLKVA